MATAPSLPAGDIEPGQVSTTTATYTNWVDTSTLGNFLLSLITTAVSGTTPTLDWTVEHSFNGLDTGGTATNIAGTLTQITGSTSLPNIQLKSFAPGGNVTTWGRYIRIKRTVAGTTPSFTTTITIQSLL